MLGEEGIKQENFRNIASSLADLKEYEFILVSSGAVGMGKKTLNIYFRDEEDIGRNVCAAVGQNVLMNSFMREFSEKKLGIAQLLLTQNDLANRETFLRAREVIEILIKQGIIPIINENDTIKSRYNKFRDNDQLAIETASKIEADMLIILTNVDGVYTKDPKIWSDARLVKELRKEDIKKILIGKKNSSTSLGGMDSKIESAVLCSQLGIQTVIANGNEKNIIDKILDGARLGTSIRAGDRIKSKKRWILLTKEKGRISIDDGVLKALKNNKSLLAAGIKEVKGNFLVNDVVSIVYNDKIVAKSIVDCSSDTLRFIKNKKTDEIKKVIKYYNCVAKHENIALIEN